MLAASTMLETGTIRWFGAISVPIADALAQADLERQKKTKTIQRTATSISPVRSSKLQQWRCGAARRRDALTNTNG
jgi:hypothetical protein